MMGRSTFDPMPHLLEELSSCHCPSNLSYYLVFLLHALIGSVLTYCIIELRRGCAPKVTAATAEVQWNGDSESTSGQSSSGQSFFGFHNVDSRDNLTSLDEYPNNHDEVYTETNGTSIMVLSELDVFKEDTTVKMARKFDEQVVSKIKKLEDCKLFLHRSRAVSALISRLMVAPDEDACYEIASRLLVPLFRAHGCGYAMLTDPDHITMRTIAVNERHDATNIGLNNVVTPLKGTMVGVVAETLEQQYCPRLKESTYVFHQELHRNVGVNSILTTPILGAGNNFVGAIILSMREEDAFSEHDRILVQDIAFMLGTILYAKRMRRAADNSHKISQKMLHSMIPSKVIEKIQVYWDENSDEFQARRSSNRSSSISKSSSTDFGGGDSGSSECSSVGKETKTDERPKIQRSESVTAKLNFLNQIHSDDTINDKMAGMMIDTASYAATSLNRALYAENVKDVVIIFADIVGFSEMSMGMSPIEVMNMLEALFSKFDALCEIHYVEKLETIGDAYICTTNLFENHHGGDVKRAALSALNMARDMIFASNDVRIPVRSKDKRRCSLQTLQVRVGIHVGEVTCGVLGERLPKFTVLGHNVNVAARMEQTAEPNKIRASEAFRDLFSDIDTDDEWDDYEVVSMKNMGSIGTFTMDPFKYGGSQGDHRRSSSD